MRYALVTALLFVGCADVRMPNAIENEQFKYVVAAITEQARVRPPVTEAEALRLTEIRKVATQGIQLTRVEIKLKGRPEVDVPEPTDYAAIHHETVVFEEAVDAELATRAALKPFLPKPNGMGLGIPLTGAGGLGAIGLTLAKMFLNKRTQRKQIERKDVALGQMFEVAKKVDKAELSEALEGTEAQAEYRAKRANGGVTA